MDILQKITEELNVQKWQVEAAVGLIDEGNTIPFISRYRKEVTGSLNDEQLRNLGERLTYLRGLEEKKEQVLSSIEEQGKLTDELKAEFDYIILDCPAGIEQGFKNAIAGADRALVVTTPEVSAVRDADRIIGLLEANEIKNPQLVVNRLRPDMIKRGDMMSADDVVDILAVELIGQVPDDENIVVATNNGEPLVGDNSLAGQAYMNICRRVIGESIPFLDLEARKGLFSWFRKK